MRVLVHGKRSWPRQYTCIGYAKTGCGAQLEVEHSDLFLVQTDGQTEVAFECLDCKGTTVVTDCIPGDREGLVWWGLWHGRRIMKEGKGNESS